MSWDRLQPTRDPTEGLSGRKWMDGCFMMILCFFKKYIMIKKILLTGLCNLQGFYLV